MSRFNLAIGVVLCALFLVVLGCGGSSADGQETSANRSGSIDDPFSGGGDMRAGSGDEPDVEVDPEDLEVPGQEYGVKKKKGRAKRVFPA